MTYALIIRSIVKETTDTKSFFLTANEKLNYKPGKFLTLLHPNSKAIRRSYSLSSHPDLDQQLIITVKRIANGEYSRWLFDQAQVDNVIETIGASGFFTLPEPLPSDSRLIFLAAGSGITPVFSLLKEVLFQHQQKVVLIYSNRSESEMIFYDQLRKLEKQFQIIVSRPTTTSNQTTKDYPNEIPSFKNGC